MRPISQQNPKPVLVPNQTAAADRVSGRLAVFVLVMAAFVASPLAGAQDYRDEPIDRSLRSRKSTVKRFVKSGGDAQAQASYNDYFTRFFFPTMKQSGAEDLGRVGEFRFSLFKEFLWSARPAIQADLTEKARRHALGVLGKHTEYHPAVSYNAVLVLGGLDAEYGSDNRGNARPSKPLPSANKVLHKVVEMGVAGQLPLHLETGALVGLERHARFVRGLPPEAQRNTLQALRLAATQTDFPAGTTDEVRAWVKRQACRGIANFGTAGRNGAFANLLISVLKDKTLPLATRCDIAGMLGEMNLQGVQGIDFAGGYPALQGASSELAAIARKVVTDYREFQLGRGGRAAQILIDPEVFLIDEEGEVTINRRSIAARQGHLRRAMQAMEAVAGDRAAEVSRYTTVLREAFAATIDEQQDDFDVVDALNSMAEEIEALAPAEANETETADADSGSAEAGVDTAGKRDGDTSRR